MDPTFKMFSPSSPSDEPGATAEEEIETLKAIYIKELEVTYDDTAQFPISVQLNLHPATADNADEQYVRLTLVINIPLKYPNKLPMFVIRNSRGLSDEDLKRIYEDLTEKAQRCQGAPMLYELIELAKEHLTSGNTPRCSCAICLYGFCNDDAFIKTDCYHYFHSNCLRRYVDCSAEVVEGGVDDEDCSDKKCLILCPVCRERVVYVRNETDASSLPPLVHSELNDNFVPDAELVRLQRKMKALYVYQKSRGGIIDVEAEKNKFLLDISVVPDKLLPVPKLKLGRKEMSTEEATSSRPRKTNEAPKRSENKLANGQSRWNRGNDSRYEVGRESRSCNNYKDACARVDNGNGSSSRRYPEEFAARENRRAPRRGSQHGRSRNGHRAGPGDGASSIVYQNGITKDPDHASEHQDGRPNGPPRVGDCNPRVPDRSSTKGQAVPERLSSKESTRPPRRGTNPGSSCRDLGSSGNDGVRQNGISESMNRLQSNAQSSVGDSNAHTPSRPVGRKHSEEFIPRENRRAPRRGSHHGWSSKGHGGGSRVSSNVHQNGTSRDPNPVSQLANGLQLIKPHAATTRNEERNHPMPRSKSFKCLTTEQFSTNEDGLVNRAPASSKPSSSNFPQNVPRNSDVNAQLGHLVKDIKSSAVCDSLGRESKRLVVTGPPSRSFTSKSPPDTDPCRREYMSRSSKAWHPRFMARTTIQPPRTP